MHTEAEKHEKELEERHAKTKKAWGKANFKVKVGVQLARDSHTD